MSEFVEGRPTDKHGHAAVVLPTTLHLDRPGGSGRSKLCQDTFDGSAPFRNGQGGPPQAPGDDIVAAIPHNAEKRVVGLHDATVNIENGYPDDIGIDEASNLCLPFPKIAIETSVLQRDRRLCRQNFKDCNPSWRERV